VEDTLFILRLCISPSEHFTEPSPVSFKVILRVAQ
jgi:hypothetical protein